MPDQIDSESQLLRAMHSYCALAARLMSRVVMRFRMVVHSMTGGLVGHYEWHRSTETGYLIPAAEPWTHWVEPARVAA
ncbi:hypothetical protein ACFYMW_12065 [Streptomyces sp. NPDC006692]|uniref:hypothetical protein n=1 Tax=Streptomyces sp. NPDC006692 TaxID=3364758 RepID=UPI0036895A47